jgi:hypothetical protein
MTDDMTTKPCACGGMASEVIAYVEYPSAPPKAIRRGWYCPDCGAWERAILREMVVVQ